MGKVSIIFRAWRKTNIIMISMISVIAFAIYYGNLLDRVTSDLFVNTSKAFQSLGEMGWGTAYISAMIVSFGSFDYWVSLSDRGNYDLLISMLLIYFIVGITIGRIMDGEMTGGFILGFISPIYIMYVVYGILYSISSSTNIDVFPIINGLYGIDNVERHIIIGGAFNGLVLGIMGMFWASVFGIKKKKKIELNPNTLKCDIHGKYCVVVDKRNIVRKPIVYRS